MSEQSYTLKEMVSKVLDQNEQILIAQAKTLVHTASTENHLASLNSKVATHVKEIEALKSSNTATKAYMAGGMAVFGFIITGVNLFLK